MEKNKNGLKKKRVNFLYQISMFSTYQDGVRSVSNLQICGSILVYLYLFITFISGLSKVGTVLAVDIDEISPFSIEKDLNFPLGLSFAFIKKSEEVKEPTLTGIL